MSILKLLLLKISLYKLNKPSNVKIIKKELVNITFKGKKKLIINEKNNINIAPLIKILRKFLFSNPIILFRVYP